MEKLCLTLFKLTNFDILAKVNLLFQFDVHEMK